MRRLALSFVLLPGLVPLALAGCNAGYSPNTYASTAAQDEANVERGVIIGVRQVMIAASGAIGAATGGAAGGVAGAQVSGGTVATALGAIGGTLVGGIGGTAAAQAISNTKGWEYIVQVDGNKLVSITQTSKAALPVGLHVLVIADSQQARIVPDYTVQMAAAPAANAAAAGSTKASGETSGLTNAEINIGPLPAADATEPLQIAPIVAASDPAIPTVPSPATAAPAVTPVAPTSPGATAMPGVVKGGTAITGTTGSLAKVRSAAGAPVATPAADSAAAPVQ